MRGSITPRNPDSDQRRSTLVVVALIAVLVGLLVGAYLCYRLMLQGVERRAGSMFATWLATSAEAEVERSTTHSRRVVRGQLSEQLVPLFTDFPYQLSDARFMGKPIDFVIFDGLSETLAGDLEGLRRIVFIDVKTGTAGLSSVQRRIKECVEDGRVFCEHVPLDELEIED